MFLEKCKLNKYLLYLYFIIPIYIKQNGGPLQRLDKNIKKKAVEKEMKFIKDSKKR